MARVALPSLIERIRLIVTHRWQEPIGHQRLRAQDSSLKTSPQEIMASGTDWRFFNELKRELKT
jgi:hypothetical protein